MSYSLRYIPRSVFYPKSFSFFRQRNIPRVYHSCNPSVHLLPFHKEMKKLVLPYCYSSLFQLHQVVWKTFNYITYRELTLIYISLIIMLKLPPFCKQQIKYQWWLPSRTTWTNSRWTVRIEEYFFRSAKPWNSLPTEIKTCSDV